MTEPAEGQAARWLLSAALLRRQCHGSLDAVADTERRALRPIGLTAHEVAVRTGALLSDLLNTPGVRLFQGLALTAADTPRLPHAVCAGRQLVLVESVAWPPGQYTVTAAGRVHCDGVYIGQSVRPLMAAVRHWRQALPPGHQVSALVVVHPARDGGMTLPPVTPRDLAWANAMDAVRDLRACLPREWQPASVSAISALAAATTAPR